MVFYLFRLRGGVNGIPLPSSAQYRLWIQPRSRHSVGNSGHPQAQIRQAAPAQVPVSPPCPNLGEKPEKEESPFVWAFLAQKGGYLLRGEEYCAYILARCFRPVNPYRYVVSAADFRIFRVQPDYPRIGTKDSGQLPQRPATMKTS